MIAGITTTRSLGPQLLAGSPLGPWVLLDFFLRGALGIQAVWPTQIADFFFILQNCPLSGNLKKIRKKSNDFLEKKINFREKAKDIQGEIQQISRKTRQISGSSPANFKKKSKNIHVENQKISDS